MGAPLAQRGTRETSLTQIGKSWKSFRTLICWHWSPLGPGTHFNGLSFNLLMSNMRIKKVAGKIKQDNLHWTSSIAWHMLSEQYVVAI